MSNHLPIVIALLIKKFGYRVDGGYEVFVPLTAATSLPPDGQIQEEVVSGEKSGFRFRYFPNQTIQGEEPEAKTAIEKVEDDRPA